MEQVTADMDDLSFDPTMKKKKPSSARKKNVAFGDPSTAEVTPETPADGTDHFKSSSNSARGNGRNRYVCWQKEESEEGLGQR